MITLKTTSLIALSLALNVTLPPEAWAVGETTRVSVASDGTQGNAQSVVPVLSADGRFVAFSSDANNLVAGDANRTYDAFIHDRLTRETTLVSVASDGSQGIGTSFPSSLSADGRFIAFYSLATNLVLGDTNSNWDLFVHDRQTGETTRVSVASDGTQGNGGSYSGFSTLSADGRFVAFTSEASNLVAGDTNETDDAFVHDRQTGETTRLSVASDGTQGNDGSTEPVLSADGRFAAFYGYPSNLVAGDTNAVADAFVHDRLTGATTLVSVASDGTQGNDFSYPSSLSADGRFVAFSSDANNLVAGDTNAVADTFVRDRLLRRSLSADLSLAISDSADPISPDESFTYTLTVTNAGPDTATKTTLTAVVPSGVRLTSALPSQGRCTGKPIVICRLKDLAPSASAEVELTVENRQASGELELQASVAAAPVDADPSNNAAVETTDIAP